jgi:choline monooxygenase
LLGIRNGHFYSIVLAPRTADKRQEDVQIYYVVDGADGLHHDAARHTTVLEGWREVSLEDVDVCESMQKGRASPVFDGGVFSPVLDNATHYFHRWSASRLAGQKMCLCPVLDRARWKLCAFAPATRAALSVVYQRAQEL